MTASSGAFFKNTYKGTMRILADIVNEFLKKF
jgi:hypothetical protein